MSLWIVSLENVNALFANFKPVSGNAESVAAELEMVYCIDSAKRPNTRSQSGSRFLVPMLLKSRLGWLCRFAL